MRKMLLPLATLDLGAERDVVAARQRARQLASLLGFGPQDQSRIATATSEMLDLAKIEAGKITEPRLELLEARDAAEGLRRAREERPRAVVLDAGVPGFAEEALGLPRGNPDTRGLPVLVRAAHPLDRREREKLQAGGARVIEVQEMLREEAARTLRAAIWAAGRANA